MVRKRRKNKTLERICKIAGGAVVGGYLVASFALGYAYRDKTYEADPPLDREEKKLLNELKGNSKALQDWIDGKETASDNRFIGSLCEETEDTCDTWLPAAYFLRTRKGDCDDVLALAHYALNKSGAGLFLGRNKTNLGSHVVYVYSDEKGLYGVISIGSSEYQPAQYKTFDEAAQSFSEHYDYYKEITLPDEDDLLLYSFNFREEAEFGPKKMFIKK